MAPGLTPPDWSSRSLVTQQSLRKNYPFRGEKSSGVPARLIEELHQKLHGSSATNNSRAVSTLQTILKSPKATSQYYMACIKELQFDAVGKRESEWREWRERNEDRVKSTEHVAALQYQAKFLRLSCQSVLRRYSGSYSVTQITFRLSAILESKSSLSSPRSSTSSYVNLQGDCL